MGDELDTTSYWTDTESIPRYPALDRDLDVDVVVVGAGITGLTAAYLLQASRAEGRRARTHAGRRRRLDGDDGARDLRHRPGSRRAGQDLRPRSRAGGLGCRFCRDRADRGDRRRRRHRLPVEAGGRRQAPAARGRLARRREGAPGGSAPRARARVRCRRSSKSAPFVDDGPASSSPGRRGSIRAGTCAPSPSASAGDGSFVFEQTPCDEVVDEPLQREGARPHHHLRVRRACDAHAADGQDQPRERDAAPDEALSLHLVRRRRPRRRRARCRTCCSGTRPIPTTTCASTSARDHDFVIFGGDDHKTGQADDTVRCFARLEAARQARDAVARDHASLVGPGDRDERRPAVHRRDVVASVRRDGLCRQRHDVRHARRDDGARLRARAGRIRGRSCSTSAARRCAAARGTTSRRTWTIPYYMIRDRLRRARRHVAAGAAGRRRARSSSSTASGSPPIAATDGKRDDALAGVHAHGLPGRMEPRREDLGLPVPRLAVPARRQGARGSGRNAARAA